MTSRFHHFFSTTVLFSSFLLGGCAAEEAHPPPSRDVEPTAPTPGHLDMPPPPPLPDAPHLAFDVADAIAVRSDAAAASGAWDGLDLALTTWREACGEAASDRGAIIHVKGTHIAAPGTYEIDEDDLAITVEQVFLRDDGRACGLETRAYDHAVAGALTITKLDDHVVEGSFEVRFADHGASYQRFSAPICRSAGERSIGCVL